MQRRARRATHLGPPTELLRGLDLPWPDPEDLDLEDLHRRVANGERPAEIAQALGTDLPCLRVALTSHPAPAQKVTRANSRAARRGRTRSRNNRSEWRKETGLQTARRLIPQDLLEDLYVQQGQSFQKIAEDRGLHPRDVSPLVDEYGLPRHNHCPGGKVDPEWLHTQYIELNRTITDIADDAGVSFTVVMRWLRTHKLTRPTGPKGNRRFSCPTHDFGDADPLLQPGLGNNYHLRRLRIFLRVAAGLRSTKPSSNWRRTSAVNSWNARPKAGPCSSPNSGSAWPGQSFLWLIDSESAPKKPNSCTAFFSLKRAGTLKTTGALARSSRPLTTKRRLRYRAECDYGQGFLVQPHCEELDQHERLTSSGTLGTGGQSEMDAGDAVRARGRSDTGPRPGRVFAAPSRGRQRTPPA